MSDTFVFPGSNSEPQGQNYTIYIDQQARDPEEFGV